MTPIDASTEVGRRFVTAIATRDWAGLATLFAPETRFRALTSGRNAFREHLDPAAAAGQIEAWFKDGDVHELLESSVERIETRVHVRYRIRNHELDGWFLVEQQAYLTPGPAGLIACDLICSGFQPTAAPEPVTGPDL